MRAAVWPGLGQSFLVVPQPDFLPAAGQALIEIELATVCGSDVHTVSGHRVSPSPSILGHEQVGFVTALGSDVPAADGSALAVGDRVVWSVAASCSTCRLCLLGLPQKCLRLRKYGHERVSEEWPLNGGFATHTLLLPGTAIVRVPLDLPAAVASPAGCATATVAAALAARVAKTGLLGDRVLITGAGMLGMTAAAMADAAGAEVTVVDPSPERRALALRFGAAAALSPGEPVADIDLAVELSGSAAAAESCLASLRVGGDAVLAGTVSTTRPIALDPEALVRGLNSVTGVHNYRPADLATAVEFLIGHHRDYPFAEVVGEPFALEDVEAAVRAVSPEILRQSVAPAL